MSKKNLMKPTKSIKDLSENTTKTTRKISQNKLPTTTATANPIIESIIEKKPEEKIPSKKTQLLGFFKTAPNHVTKKANNDLTVFKEQIRLKNKPSNRLKNFFSKVPSNIAEKSSKDFKELQTNLAKGHFEEEQKKFNEDLEKEQKKQEKIEKGLIKVKQNKQKSQESSIVDPEVLKQLEEAERQKEIERENNKRKLIEAEKKKMLLEQRLRELDKEIQNIETSVSQRLLEETELQNQQIIKKIEKESKEQAQIQANELAKKMQKMRQEQEEKRKKLREDMDNALIQRLESEKKRQEESQEKYKEEKRKIILEKLEKINKRKEERKLANDTSISLIKQSRSHYQQTLTSISKNYEKNTESELERKKKELETRRNLYKPLNGEELKQHAQKYDDQRRLKEQESRVKIVKDQEEKRGNAKKYESLFLKQVLEKDSEERRKNDKYKENRKLLVEKQQKYQHIIKDLFKPKADPQKIKELENRILIEQQKGINKNMRNNKRKEEEEDQPNNNFLFEQQINSIGETNEQNENEDNSGGVTGMKPQSEFSGQKSRKKLKINYELPWKTIKQNDGHMKTTEDLNKEFIEVKIQENKNSKRYLNYIKVKF